MNAQLIDTRTDAHLWAQIYDRRVTDVFATQSEIANQLQAKIARRSRQRIGSRIERLNY